jgi:hypothetical protein
MGEAIVDLFYRGLPLGSRARMTHIEGRTAYVELPGPMPIGTPLAIQVDGLSIPARVVEIYEQTAGTEKPAGMRLRPSLESDAERQWWASASGGALPPPEAPKPAPVAEAKPAEEPVEEAAKPAARAEEAPAAVVEPDRPMVAEDVARPVAVSAAAHDTVEMQAMPDHLAAAIAASEESTDVHPVVSEPAADATGEAAEAAVDAPVTDEASGVVEADSPEPPSAGGDSAPRGRKNRRNKRR